MFLKTILDRTEKSGSVTLVLANDQGTGEEAVTLSTGEWKRMTKANPLGETDEITEERYDAIHAAAERTAAVREGARLLASSDHSAADVRKKLRYKGFSEESAKYAAAFLEKKGFLNDAEACARYAESALRTKQYGRRRILDYLIARGYGREEAENAVNSLPDEEIRAALSRQIERKFPDLSTFDRDRRQKAVQALLRLGFSGDEIREALKDLRSVSDERQPPG